MNLVYSPDAVERLRELSTRSLTAVLNNIALLIASPHPAGLGQVFEREDGLYLMRVSGADVSVIYEVIGDATVRIITIEHGRR